ncbi:MAG: hypothetical protein K2Q22_16075 [Cytophagales bacterium]|nr:hypothetical protein [Cytophagales bacterium]
MDSILRTKLYDSFTTLVYTIILADGVIDEAEKQIFGRIIKLHPRSSDPAWKFNFQEAKEISIMEAYKETMDVCKQIGKNEEITQLVNLLEEISKVSKSPDEDDESLVESFLEKFKSKL